MMQVFDLVGPPGDVDFAPLGGEPRMVPLFFGGGADGIGEGDGVFEVFEFVQAVEFGNVIFADLL